MRRRVAACRRGNFPSLRGGVGLGLWDNCESRFDNFICKGWIVKSFDAPTIAVAICRNIRGNEMSSRFTQYILFAMVLGIGMGTLVFNFLPDSRVEIANDVNLIAMLFLRLIKMIIAPLV